MNGRFLLHCRGPKNWRLRNSEEHPLDPGWEEGSYICCHPHVRRLLKEGTRIVDVVVNEKGKPIVRSAFVVTGARSIGNSRALYFDEFYFADGKPFELPSPYIQYRQMTMQTFSEKYPYEPPLWEKIERTYTRYMKGNKPISIDQESWDRMKEIAAKAREKHQLQDFAGKGKVRCR